MKIAKSTNFLKPALLVLCGSVAFIALSAQATVVTWSLNPSNLDQSVGSSSNTYTVSGYDIAAYGYDNNGGTGVARDLFYKNAGSDEIGLGLVGITNHELQVDSHGNPLQFIQLNITSILNAGFFGGKIEVGSVQSGELFDLYGSNALGVLGTKLNSTSYDSSTDDQFVSVPNFGTYKYISVVAAGADVMPVAFEAQITPVPEATSILPTAFLAIVVTAFEARRRRRVTA
jgi:hypothetical protein